MTIKEFFEAYLDFWIETNKGSDISTLDQCVDLWRVYNLRVVGGPFMYGNAVDFWTNYPVDFYEKIPNTPTGVPQLGDVIIWGTKYGKYGHIAICTDIADTKTFTSFDQNDPIGSSCHYQPHNYSGVLGWLRPKNQEAIYGQPGQEKALEVITEAFSLLPDDDPLKQGNLEGYTRQLVDEHKKFKEYGEKADLLDGFIIKWVREWNLSEGSDLVEIEDEMGKLHNTEFSIGELREAAEKAVGKPYEDDKSLIMALGAVGTEVTTLKEDLGICQKKIEEWHKKENQILLKILQFRDFIIKIFRKKGGEEK